MYGIFGSTSPTFHAHAYIVRISAHLHYVGVITWLQQCVGWGSLQDSGAMRKTMSQQNLDSISPRSNFVSFRKSIVRSRILECQDKCQWLDDGFSRPQQHKGVDSWVIRGAAGEGVATGGQAYPGAVRWRQHRSVSGLLPRDRRLCCETSKVSIYDSNVLLTIVP